MMDRKRIYLSPPHLGDREGRLIAEALESNWVAPLGPFVDKFEALAAERAGVGHAVALSSGTAAIHLALRAVGIGERDRVLCSTLTFIGSAGPIRYLGAEPVFVDSEWASWNLDPDLLAEELASGPEPKPKAVVVTDVMGQCADYTRIQPLCRDHGVALIEDAAEALGASCGSAAAGSFGECSVVSFNGNKIITTSGGGMLLSDNSRLVERARFWATQARDSAPHYQHRELGYNYRLSNILAALGCGQLESLDDRVRARRSNFDYYREHLEGLPGLSFMPEAPWGRSTRWLTCITVDPELSGTDRETVRLALESENIEARPVWKPLHLQPLFKGCRVIGGGVASRIFEQGLCLPSGSAMTEADLDLVSSKSRQCWSE